MREDYGLHHEEKGMKMKQVDSGGVCRGGNGGV